MPILGKRPVGSVTRADIQQLANAWATTLAPRTVARLYSSTRALCGYAESADLIVRSPCRDIRLPHVRIVDRPILSVDQLSRLAEELGPDQGPMMWTAAVFGLRWAECAGLAWRRLTLFARP